MNDTTESSMTYLARCPGCQRAQGAVVDTPDVMKTEGRRLISQWLGAGLKLERITTEQARTEPWGCSCPPRRRR